jgi:putative two-component system response regulator
MPETTLPEEGPAERSTLLLVDDNATNLQVLRSALEGAGHKLLAARNGQAALTIARKARPDLILLDIMMPEMDGYEVCRRLKAHADTRHIPVIFLTALSDVEDEARGLALGAVDYITKPLHPELVRARVHNHLELKRYRDDLERMVAERTREIAMTQAAMIESLATLAEYRDPQTGGHIKRTQNYVKALALHLKDHPRFRDTLDDAAVEWLYLSAPLHDIGKVGVRDEVLLKGGELDPAEFEEMKRHAQYGHDTLDATERKLGRSTFLRFAKEIALTHQEKWDGSGYPNGLRGAEIPVSGRLMALADVYDALISQRSYKPPFSHEEAVAVIREGSGTHFDPDVVTAFLEIQDTFRNIALTFADHEEERRMLAVGDRPRTAGRPGTALLVEDNEVNLAIMESQLRRAGLAVVTATDGRQALARLERTPADFVLTDIEMPGMDGYGLVREIRRREGDEGPRLPVFAITASEFDLTEAGARAAGFDGFMLKPLDVEVLQRRLAAAGCALDTGRARP